MSLVVFVGGHRDPWWVYPAVFAGLAVIGLFFWLLDRIVTHFFPSTRRRYVTSVGNALMRIEGTFLPGREHIAEAHEHERVDEDDHGEPPETGNAQRPWKGTSVHAAQSRTEHAGFRGEFNACGDHQS